MKIINDFATSPNKKVAFTIFKHEEQPNSLAIIFPGVGYTAQAPLLHYSCGIYFKKGYDILQVNYNYPREIIANLSEEDFYSDVESVLKKALTDNTYSNFVFIAKSMGTIALSYFITKPEFSNAKSIWLTPLIKRNDVYNALLTLKSKGLCIVGGIDPTYDSSKFNDIKTNKNIEPILIEGTNHNLEFDNDVLKSIEAISIIMNNVVKF
ncbi:alpha/beta hydrolase (plasmid) [Niallia taxi]|uniref:alpha/beta hydrolase n=1 Tax=Niallia taxi TaxID=2499688 RepID=UPI002934C5C7|nr:alpha/beta hydrolase [Niallia taxi]WOD65301.1 alpha/beta hydrolase [Niallia taxi]